MDKHGSRHGMLPLQTAAEWWVRLRDRRAPPDDTAEWLAWSAEDSAHTKAFERIRELGDELEAVDASTRRAFIAEFARPSSRSWVTRTRAIAASLALLVLAGGHFAWNRMSGHTELATQSYATPIAVNRSVTLADGSRMILGGASAVQTRFGNGVRRVSLQRGEAYFKVAHDKHHSFIVSAGELKVRAIGTAFDVRRTGERVTVTVTEGIVQIAQGDVSPNADARGALVAVAGQQVVHDPAASGLTVATADTGQVLGWQEDRLQFVNEPLGVVVANINRYAHKPVRITDPTLESIAFTGTVSPKALDNWGAALPQVFPVNVRVTDTAIVISARDHGSP